MSNDIIALISVLIAVAALLLTLWQNILTRRAAEAQVFLTVEQLGIDAAYREGIIAIASLKSYDDFDQFSVSESQETQRLIFQTVEFLNFAAHLADKKYLPRQTIWDLYFWGYRTCNQKLIPWWVEGHRRKHPRRFSTFERMCKRVGSISNEAIAAHDMKRYRNT